MGDVRSVKDVKSGLAHLPCLESNRMVERKKICKDKLDDDTRNCLDNFCAICCQSLALGQELIFDCTNECNNNSVQEKNLND